MLESIKVSGILRFSSHTWQEILIRIEDYEPKEARPQNPGDWYRRQCSERWIRRDKRRIFCLRNPNEESDEVESDDIKVSGVICRNFSKDFSRKQSNSLKSYLKEIVSIQDIDTRALVSHIREYGVQNCIISSEIFDISVLKDKLKP